MSILAARRLAVASLIISLAPHVFCTGEKPAPISIPPSQYWEGNDGPWSSFGVQIGTPPQSVRVLPSTSGSSLWTVLPQGCISSDPTNCWSLRGFLFHPNESSTWSDQGLFQLPLHPLDTLGYGGNADFGFDNTTLAWPGQGGVTLDHQVIAGFAAKDFYVGMMGLSPRPVNFTDFNHPEPSMLGSLASKGVIPSESWGYTAGAPYRARRPYGSLTLGGYDSARFTPNSLTFSFGPDTSQSLLVGVQAIANSDGDSLLPNGIIASIDSTVPHIWLPVEACQKFESSFGLTWDESTNLYLVNSTWHNALVAKNATVTFKLGPNITGGETIDIDFPYASFDLEFTSATKNFTSRYFPLRRANNSVQYTLGRAFLQETYLIVDHTRSNFSISKTSFPDIDIIPTHLVPIFPPNSTNSTTPPTSHNHPPKHHISPPIIAGIIIGALIFLAFICLVLYRLRHWLHKVPSVRPIEMGGTEIAEMVAMKTYEMPNTTIPAEMEAHSEPGELANSEVRLVQVPGPPSELPGGDIAGSGPPSQTQTRENRRSGHRRTPIETE